MIVAMRMMMTIALLWLLATSAAVFWAWTLWREKE